MMLKLSRLNTYYDQAHILRNMSLKVEAGEVVALLGRNGAGKSTTMKAIIGTVPATSGTIKYCGHDLRKLENYEAVRLGIGYVPEDRRIFRKLTVLENLITGQKPPRAGQEPWTIKRVYELFPKLEEIKARLGEQLSGGEQQMLTVGRTLMTNPSCLLLDEPTEGLAPVLVQQVTAAIQHLKRRGLAVLMSEQNRNTAASLADRVYVLEKGKIIYEGKVKDMPATAQKALGW
ncbi:MAG TPA: ABC transporter ATP-binding protein [Rhodospirillaceae bacterium]|nr:ABC transporter ATP-binding protein [Rhodospirillaceae bacterium]